LASEKCAAAPVRRSDGKIAIEPLTMSKAAAYSAIEPLRDGRSVEIRALRPDDRDDLLAAVGRTSTQSLYRRFFAVRRSFSEQETDFFLNVDFVNHVALVAMADEGGRPTIVGGGRYIVVAPGQAEVAFAVVDAYQGQGVGAALMRHLTVIAGGAGLQELIAEVLPDNAPMLKVFEKCGLRLSTRRDAGVVHVTLRLV
jgi:RimJ/RimL family protein N-acetyltransferase